jgi:RNA polymerase sigma-70 factor (ECF subfamily)
LRAIEHETDERRLIEAAQRDPGRFAEVYEANFGRVYAYVARRVPGREEAEDVTAEVFQQALAGLAGFEWQGTPFIAWLLGIAAHLVAKRWKIAAAKEEVPVDELELAANEGHAARQAVFAQSVERLPEDQRRVIEARFFGQCSIRDIAVEMGRSEGAIKQLQFRALETLRDQIGNRHE